MINFRLFPLTVEESATGAYIVLFGPGYIRFFQNGEYVLDDPVVDDVTSGGLTDALDPGTLLFIDGISEPLIVSSSGDLFNLLDEPITLTGAQVTYRVVTTLTNPFAVTEFYDIGYTQARGNLYLCHKSREPYVLSLAADGTWSIAVAARDAGKPLTSVTISATDTGKFIKFVRVTAGGSGYDDTTTLTVSDATGSGAVLIPTIQSGGIVAVTIQDGGQNYTAPTITASVGTGATFEIGLSSTDAGTVIAVSAIVDGKETGISRPTVLTGIPDITAAAGSYTYSWTAVAGAEAYRVYRALIFPDGADAHAGYTLGLVGETIGTTFTDVNIQPDFTQTPIIYNDPFAPGAITSIDVTAAGSGYTAASTVTVTDATGTGFVGYPIVNSGGGLIGIYIANPGTGYTNPTTAVSDGSSATFTENVTPTTGTYPQVVAFFQQRLVYANTLNNPMTLWASRVDELDNFSASSANAASDAYSYTVDADAIAPIRNMVSVQNGLLVFTAQGVSQLTGSEGGLVTAADAILIFQSFVGASAVKPSVVGDEILYMRDKSRAVQLLVFNPTARRFDNSEISTLSRHLFEPSPVRSIAFTHAVNRKGIGVFEDGSAFMLTLDSTQRVFAFSRMQTKGIIVDVVALQFGQTEQFYFLVERNGFVSVERMQDAEGGDPEREIWLDAALQIPLNEPQVEVFLSGKTGVIEVTSNSDVFTGAMANGVFGAFGGRGIISTVNSSRSITVTLTRPANLARIEDGFPIPAAAGKWWWLSESTSVINAPFRGEEVVVVVDGVLTGVRTPSTSTIPIPNGLNLVEVLCGVPEPEPEVLEVNAAVIITSVELSVCGPD